MESRMPGTWAQGRGPEQEQRTPQAGLSLPNCAFLGRAGRRGLRVPSGYLLHTERTLRTKQTFITSVASRNVQSSRKSGLPSADLPDTKIQRSPCYW